MRQPKFTICAFSAVCLSVKSVFSYFSPFLAQKIRSKFFPSSNSHISTHFFDKSIKKKGNRHKNRNNTIQIKNEILHCGPINNCNWRKCLYANFVVPWNDVRCTTCRLVRFQHGNEVQGRCCWWRSLGSLCR